jgi:hypothetical protein
VNRNSLWCLVGLFTGVGCAPSPEPAAGQRRAAILEPERGTDQPVLGNANLTQDSATAASSGDGYLVAWADQRRDPFTSDIYAARLGATGEVLDPTGIPVAVAGSPEVDPAVVWNGQSYFVVWSAPADDNGSQFTNGFEVWGRRIGRDGVPLGSPILLVNALYDQKLPKVAWNGTHHLVVWQNGFLLPIQGVRVDRDGRIVDPKPIDISRPVYQDLTPDVASDGRDFFVVWEDDKGGGTGRDISGAIVRADGTVASAADITLVQVPGYQMNPMVTWVAGAYVVAWEDSRPSPTGPPALGALWGTRVGPDGTVREPDGNPFNVSATSQTLPSLASDGQRAWLTWNEGRVSGPISRFGTFVGASGPVADPRGTQILAEDPDRGLITRFVWGGGNYLGVWGDLTGSSFIDPEIRAQRFTAAGAAVDTTARQVTHAANRQMEPAIGTDGQGYLLAWSDTRNDEGDIYATRLDSAGRALDDPAIVVARATGRQGSAAVVWNGAHYVIAWVDYAGNPPVRAPVRGARVGSDGRLMDAAPIALGTVGEGEAPQLAWSGAHPYVWVVGADGNVSALRLSRDGTVLDTPSLKLISPGSAQSGDSPAITCGSASCLVAWLDRGFPNGQAPDLRGVRLGFDGQVLDTVPLTLVARPGWQGNPRLAWHGSSYLLVYTDADRDSWNPDVYGASIGVDGVVTKAPFLIAEGNGNRPQLAVTWTGTHFLAAWDTNSTQNARSDLHGARVTEAGAVVDLPAQSLVTTRYAVRRPGLASLGGGTAALTYWGFDDAAGLGSERVKVRLFDNSPASDAGAPGPDASPDTTTALSPDAGVDAAPDLAQDAAPIADAALMTDLASDSPAPPIDAGARDTAGPIVDVRPLDTSAPDAEPSPVAADAGAGEAAKTKSAGCSCTAAGDRPPEGKGGMLMTALLTSGLAATLRRPRRRTRTDGVSARAPGRPSAWA